VPTGLLAGLSPEINPQINGGYIIPWGRLGHLEKNVAAGIKQGSEGATGIAKEFP
jgi:retinol dehydrogenase-12